MAALLAGQGVTEVAEAYHLNESTVRNWKKLLPEDGLAEVSAKKSADLEAKIFGYLGANFTALQAQARVAGDEAYLRKCPAQQLAVLHGVMADKAVRLLEALSGNPEEPGDSGIAGSDVQDATV